MILSKSNVINIQNIDKFCDMLVDMHNSFAKETSFIQPCNYNIKKEEKAGLNKKIWEFSNNIKNLLSTKLLSKPDYIEVVLKMINMTKDLEIVFGNRNLNKEDSESLRERKVLISLFFYNVVFKLIMQDLKNLTMRFLKKKIISFENK